MSGARGSGFETSGPVRAVLFDGSGEIEARALVWRLACLPTANGGRASTAQRPWRLLRRDASEASQCQATRSMRRGRQPRPGRPQPVPLRQASGAVVRAATPHGHDVKYLVRDPPRPTSRALAARWCRGGATAPEAHISRQGSGSRGGVVELALSSSGPDPTGGSVPPSCDDKGFVVKVKTCCPTWAQRGRFAWPLRLRDKRTGVSPPVMFDRLDEGVASASVRPMSST